MAKEVRVERVIQATPRKIIVSPFVLPTNRLVPRTAAMNRKLMQNDVVMP